MNKRVILIAALVIFAAALYGQNAGDFTIKGTVLTKYNGKAAEVVIPANLGITEIGGRAFDYPKITSVVIPAGVTTIGDWAFSGCENLTAITVNEQNTAYTSVDGVLFNKAKTTLIKYPAGKQGQKYTIPNSVTSIERNAFSYCTSLTSVTIPNSVISIGDGAFYSCRSLASITIPDSVTSIGRSAFDSCKGLTSITIPNSVTSIERDAFSFCRSLASITIPNSVTSIGDGAFYSCRSLASITIPNSVTSIGELAFYSCSSLTVITVNEQNTAYASVDGVLFNKAKTTLIMYPQGKQGQNYTIPNGVKQIGDYAFDSRISLISVTIPVGVTFIGDFAFRRCSNLTSITIPPSVTEAGLGAFGGCDALPESIIAEIEKRFGEDVLYLPPPSDGDYYVD